MLEHPWLQADVPGVVNSEGTFKNLLPQVRKGFSAKSTWKSALTKVRAANNFKLLDAETRQFKEQLDEIKGESTQEEPVRVLLLNGLDETDALFAFQQGSDVQSFSEDVS